MNQRRFLTMLSTVLLPLVLSAQLGTVTGTVTDAATGDALPGANVVVEGTIMGAAADANGDFSIANVPSGSQTLTASVIGYEDASETVSVPAGGTVTANFSLESSAIMLSALEVLADRATRQTPVAYTNVSRSEIEFRLGSQDIPLVMNTTPSVYATGMGGGAGDARINVRGFNQRNVAIMINGVPVNDMENGWVYWSNWDGISDATSSIQLQRGLSAVNLAAPSIGGTMNILTDPTSPTRGGRFKQEYGTGTFLKSTLTYHTGLIGDRLALSGTIVRKTGQGLVDKAWTDAWAYYFGASFAASSKNRFELFALGAPQRHGQNRYMQNIAAYGEKYAKTVFSDAVLNLDEEGAEDADGNDIPNGVADVFDTFPESGAGRFYNENWNEVSSDYKGKQYYYMYGAKTVDRYDPKFLNERENYFHKPQVNLNWYLTLSGKAGLFTSAYFSGGSGGGTGTFGDITWDYGAEPTRIADWDLTIERNRGTTNRKGKAKPAGEAIAFLRNSINRQWTLGAISKLKYDLSDELKLQFGVDWRTAEIEHAREVRDLLDGSYAVNGDYNNRGTVAGVYEDGTTPYEDFYNEFDWVMNSDGTLNYDATLVNASGKGLGDIINYHNTNTVNWLGGFLQAEYRKDFLSIYGMGGYSLIKYSLVDHFKKAENYSGTDFSATSKGELAIDADWINAIQFKGGGLYQVADNLGVYVNFGYVEKVPIFDSVIDDIGIALASDPTNEKFISAELGLNLTAMDGALASKINLYNTSWRDRNLVRIVSSGAGSSGDTDLIFLTGLNQNHLGAEVELAYQPMQLLRLDAALTFGNWTYGDDATGTYKDVVNQTSEEYTYAVKDLKIGDMPQTIYSVSATLFPIDGLRLRADFAYYDRFWADWDPLDREVETGVDPDREQNWRVPAYSKINLHGAYDLPLGLAGVRIQAFFHIFNALDAIYVQDAIDNSSFNAFGDDGKNHAADDAEVYLGTPRYFNTGLSLRF